MTDKGNRKKKKYTRRNAPERMEQKAETGKQKLWRVLGISKRDKKMKGGEPNFPHKTGLRK